LFHVFDYQRFFLTHFDFDCKAAQSQQDAHEVAAPLADLDPL
jgi:hypothetical protein